MSDGAGMGVGVSQSGICSESQTPFACALHALCTAAGYCCHKSTCKSRLGTCRQATSSSEPFIHVPEPSPYYQRCKSRCNLTSQFTQIRCKRMLIRSKPTTEFAQPRLRRVKARPSPSRGYKFGCVCSKMAGREDAGVVTGHIGTNTPKFVRPRWG